MSFSVSSVKAMLLCPANNSSNVQTVHECVTSGSLSKSMSERMAGSGLKMGHLRMAYTRVGRQGIDAFFGERVDGAKGNIRVKKNKRIIDNVCKYLERLCK